MEYRVMYLPPENPSPRIQRHCPLWKDVPSRVLFSPSRKEVNMLNNNKRIAKIKTKMFKLKAGW